MPEDFERRLVVCRKNMLAASAGTANPTFRFSNGVGASAAVAQNRSLKVIRGSANPDLIFVQAHDRYRGYLWVEIAIPVEHIDKFCRVLRAAAQDTPLARLAVERTE